MHNLDGVAPMIECAMARLNLLRYSNGEPYDKSAIQNALDILERCRKVARIPLDLNPAAMPKLGEPTKEQE